MSLMNRTTILRSAALSFALLIALPVSYAQAPADPPPAVPLLSPEQLDNLVAPIALYPDPLLGQVLSASTYPLEIVQAQQWLSQNSNLKGTELAEAARQQNWDPSVQALVVLPNALALLANDIRWATELGNAFLAQQADVMSAVQRMRARAQSNGKLATTPQQVVTTTAQDGQNAIVIQPADPQVIYVPVYNPTYVYGPPVWGAYPSLWYPDGFGFGFGFGPAYYMGSYYPGWGGWGGWGWGCGWFGGGLYVNVGFYNRYGYGYRGGYGRYGGYGGYGSGYGGHAAWSHDPGHRMGVAYPNRNVANQFHGNFAGGPRNANGQWNGGSSQYNRAAGAGSFGRSSTNYSANGGARNYQSRSATGQGQSGQNFSASQSGSRWSTAGGAGYSQSRSYSAPSQSYSAPRSSSGSSGYGGGGYSAPRSYSAPSSGYSAPRSYSAPSSSYSAPRSSSGGGSGFSGGRSSGGGFSGGHSSGGGGGGGGHRR
jgi:hypothetical protein